MKTNIENQNGGKVTEKGFLETNHMYCTFRLILLALVVMLRLDVNMLSLNCVHFPAGI